MTQIPAVNPTAVVANSDCGPTKMFRYQIDLASTPNFEIDFTQQFQGGQVAAIQSIFVDNSLNTSTLTLSLNSNQDIKIPARAQGYIRLLCDNPPKINDSSAGAVIIEIFPLSFPTDTFIWDSQGNLFTFNGSNELLVADVGVRAAIIANLMQSQGWVTGDQQVAKPLWGADEIYTLNGKTAAGDTNIQAAPGANIGFFIKEIQIRVTRNAAMAAAGINTILIREGAAGATIMSATFWLPAAALTTDAGSDVIVHLCNLNYNFKQANLALVANLATALTAGEVSINVCGGTTTIIGP